MAWNPLDWLENRGIYKPERYGGFNTSKYDGYVSDDSIAKADPRLVQQMRAAEETPWDILKSMGRSLLRDQPKRSYPGTMSYNGANEDYRMGLFNPGDASGAGQAAKYDQERQRRERLRQWGLY